MIMQLFIFFTAKQFVCSNLQGKKLGINIFKNTKKNQDVEVDYTDFLEVKQ